MNQKFFVGYALRFQETRETFTHLDILEQYGEVLWGQWRKPSSTRTYSTNALNAIKESPNGMNFYGIGSNTVWKMHVKDVLFVPDIKEKKLEYLIPDYYDINTPCYCWYLIDDIVDYGNKDCLKSLVTANNTSYDGKIAQIPGCSPYRVYSITDKEFEISLNRYIPQIIFRNAKNIERNKMSQKLRFEVFQKYGNKCTICGRTPADGVYMVVDHIVPIAKGGKTEPSNLRVLCNECNSGKSDTLPVWKNDQWI